MMSRVMIAMISAIIGVIVFFFIQSFLSDTISSDSYDVKGTLNLSQIDAIRSIDSGNILKYSFVNNESADVSGSIKLNTSQLSFASLQGVNATPTYDGMILGMVDILPYVFVIVVVLGVFMHFAGGFEHEPASSRYKHKSDPISNPKYESTGPIHRNKNYDRIN